MARVQVTIILSHSIFEGDDELEQLLSAYLWQQGYTVKSIEVEEVSDEC